MDVTSSRPLNLLVVTVFNPPDFGNRFLPAKSTVKAYRMMGWYANNDGS